MCVVVVVVGYSSQSVALLATCQPSRKFTACSHEYPENCQAAVELCKSGATVEHKQDLSVVEQRRIHPLTGSGCKVKLTRNESVKYVGR